MRHFTSGLTVLYTLALLYPLTSTHAAPHKPHTPAGKPIRTIDNRVTVFYEFKTKDGKYHKMASVSKTVLVKVSKPAKPHTP